MAWDFFISHAFEDKEFARALADALTEEGCRVWFDEFELKVGDSLRRSINLGLSRSRFGIVVLSPNFFAKEWTQKELDALTARETKRKKIILPIWHNVSIQEVRKYSPILADRLAINSATGIQEMVQQLMLVFQDNRTSLSRNKAKTVKHLGMDSEQLITELEKIKRSLAIKETELKAVIAQADETAHTDDLTFLPNRRQIIGDLQREVIFSKRYSTPLSIFMLDIDNFKQINDTYGHIVGDEVLRSLAGELRKIIRYPGTIGRYAGDVFLLVLPKSTPESASSLAEHLCQQVRSTPIVAGQNTFHLTISMGIAQYKIHKEDWRELLERADQALYKAKSNGRDQWAIL